MGGRDAPKDPAFSLTAIHPVAPRGVEVVRAECSSEIAIPIEVAVDGCFVGVQAASPAECTVEPKPVTIAEITKYGVVEDSYRDVSICSAGEILCDGWCCELRQRN